MCVYSNIVRREYVGVYSTLIIAFLLSLCVLRDEMKRWGQVACCKGRQLLVPLAIEKKRSGLGVGLECLFFFPSSFFSTGINL